MKRLLAVAAVAAAASAVAPPAHAAECHTAGLGVTVTATVCVHLREYCQADYRVEENAFGTHEEVESSICIPPPNIW